MIPVFNLKKIQKKLEKFAPWKRGTFGPFTVTQLIGKPEEERKQEPQLVSGFDNMTVEELSEILNTRFRQGEKGPICTVSINNDNFTLSLAADFFWKAFDLLKKDKVISKTAIKSTNTPYSLMKYHGHVAASKDNIEIFFGHQAGTDFVFSWSTFAPNSVDLSIREYPPKIDQRKYRVWYPVSGTENVIHPQTALSLDKAHEKKLRATANLFEKDRRFVGQFRGLPEEIRRRLK